MTPAAVWLPISSPDLMVARNAYVKTLSQAMNPSVGAMFRRGIDDPGGLIGRYGWRVVRVAHPGEADADFGRWVAPRDTGAGFSLVMDSRVEN